MPLFRVLFSSLALHAFVFMSVFLSGSSNTTDADCHKARRKDPDRLSLSRDETEERGGGGEEDGEARDLITD